MLMADNKKSIFQRLGNAIIGFGNGASQPSVNKIVTNYTLANDPSILYKFDNKEERDAKLLQMKQEKLLAYQWVRNAADSTVIKEMGKNMVRVMYRDADLMDNGFPEIGRALDVVSEEATTFDQKGVMLHIDSTSDRIKGILEDLFLNRLDINIMLPMIVRATAKYGNEFMLLNISKNGILGWRELPVHEINRIESGMQGVYGGGTITNDMKVDEVEFVWEGHNQAMPYKNWQVAHFRLINNSVFLPYGASALHKARRAWRMLSMMEDSMLLYRLERSIERRVFKINVGNIDDYDVKGYLQEFANTFKRAPIIDPTTGQLDLRKNFLDVSADYFIPVRPGADPTNIESLQSAQNITSMDDIEYMLQKVLTALCVPRTFLNFKEAQGKAQSMSSQDVRFARSIVKYQQAVLVELTKVAIIHLYLLGFKEDLTNFSLSLNNPSSQIEDMALERLQNRLNAATTALQDPGGGIPLMSWHRAQREIMGLTEDEIKEVLLEMRLERALSAELGATTQIIQRTHLCDKVDRIYGKPGAEYTQLSADEEGGPGGGLGGGGGMMGGGDFGGGLDDLGEPGDDFGGDLGGEEGSADLSSMGGEGGGEPLSETLRLSKEMFRKRYLPEGEERSLIDKMIDENFAVNSEINSMINDMENSLDNSGTTKEIID